MNDIEAHAKEMAAASGWHWPTLGESGHLGREGWRQKALAAQVHGSKDSE